MYTASRQIMPCAGCLAKEYSVNVGRFPPGKRPCPVRCYDESRDLVAIRY